MASPLQSTPARPEQDSQYKLPPLVIDLDGTLLRADFLWETALSWLRFAPWRIFAVLYWLAFGRARLKAELARRAELDVSLLPVNEDMAALAITAKHAGREILLATAADEALAARVAARFPFIDRVIASNGVTNLKGAAKLMALQVLFPQGFDYAGDSRADLPIWRAAEGVIVVNAAPSTLRAARALGEPLAVLPRPGRLRAEVKLLRPHQWVKNALIFVPLVLAGMMLDGAAVRSATLAFVSLCIVASATYALNDLLDIEDDRRHWSKRRRPLASGDLPIAHGVALAGGGLALGFAVAALAGPAVVAGVAAYLAGTLLYSLALKPIPIVDVTTLAGLFTLRLAIGCIAAGAPMSPWLLTFSMFLFVSLSLAKRHTEIARAGGDGVKKKVRGYSTADEPFVVGLGMASMVAAILVFVLYLTQEAFTAAHLAEPKLLWAFPPALFLISGRVWLISGRGELHDDPVAFAVKDRASLAVVALLGVVFVAAWLGPPHI
ncbi:UbiA family prenyltransferase [Rhodoblastus sp.]|uniref:UbiA family prenyltransferase n=1 Tax=Rhodoblastus sp. TaxID=1962975 RepID=UPI0026026073|nr:UbiA family prenyltransferase [Rhodoblastus sp.]